MMERKEELKELETLRRQLDACERRLGTVFIKNRDGILIVDRSKIIRFANEAAAAIFASSPQELVGREFLHPIESERVTELRLEVEHGPPAVVEIWGAETEWDGADVLLVSLHDVTRQKRAEEELRKLQHAVTESPSMVMITDSRGDIEYVNPKFTEVTGYTLEEVVGRNPRFLRSDRVPPEEYRRLWKSIAAGNEWRGEFINRNKNGELSYQSVSIAPVTDAEGRITDYIAVMEDISERKRTEAEIATLNQRLADRAAQLKTVNEELEAFNHMVSRSLRRPITNINSYCQVIRELCGSELKEQCAKYLDDIYDASLHMSHLIDALLKFSRLTLTELHLETVDLTKMAEVMASGLTSADPSRRVSFRIARGISARGDSRLLWIVLENLFSNAWKYTAEVQDAVIEFGMTEIRGKPAYFVRDNGTGFEKGKAEKLFLPFPSLPEGGKGYGVGLATVERIIKHHGGIVWASGEPGKGATFYFTLPA